MTSKDLTKSLTILFSELLHGAPEENAFMLNPGDIGMLASLDSLSASATSASSDGGATIASHLEHLRYALSLMNRWAVGENPFAEAHWSASWERQEISEADWIALRTGFREEAERWLENLGTERELDTMELNGVVGSIAHLAYHFGAMRQIAPSLRGPKAED